MKAYIKIAALLLLVACATKSFSQTTKTPGKRNYVVITSNLAQLKPIVEAAHLLAQEDGNLFGDFQVIVCGKTVTDLAQKDTSEPLMALAEKAGVKVLACGFSLKAFQVNHETLPKGMGVVENGLFHNFQLQKKGYFSIDL